MDRMRRIHLLAENFGILRQDARFVRRDVLIGEVELIERVRHNAAPSRDIV